MQTNVESQKARGRLSREVQYKLGESLHAMFNEIVNEGVPDRFVKLLQQLDGSQPEAARKAEPSAQRTIGATGSPLDPNDVGQCHDEPGDKGTR